MMTFNQYLMEEAKQIEEAGLIINKNDGAYPKDGQILIMAGGGGSGKSFILENLLLFEGKIFNIDQSKEFLRIYGKKPNGSIALKFKDIEKPFMDKILSYVPDDAKKEFQK